MKHTEGLPSNTSAPRTLHPSRRRGKLALFLMVAVGIRLLTRAYHRVSAVSTADVTEEDFDWDKLIPSEDIRWTTCFDDFKCAKLLLPLDYLSPPGYGPNVSIALQMLPATDTENYKGTLLVNPGGPGGSGTDYALSSGKRIQTIVGAQYDVLGFDPRGTGESTPHAECFGSASEFGIWRLQDGPLLKVDDGSVPFARARERVVAEKCVQAIGGNGKEEANGTIEEWGGGRFISTASVATDMLKITEKLAQEKVKYWGFSYGSVLGQYFSAMYPDKVGRVLIDGVFDGVNYRGDLPYALWSNNVVDLEKVRGSFYTFCHQAGPEKCPLYESSPEKIQARVDAAIDQLETAPFALPFAEGGPKVLQKKALINMFFRASYKPAWNFGSVAEMILALEQQNATTAAQLDWSPGVQCRCETEPWNAATEAFYAIACGDAGPQPFDSAEYDAFLRNITAASPTGGPVWAIHYIQCAEWKVRAKWRYEGPLGANETAHPLMLISPRYDPVCPLPDGRKVHARFPGAGLLVQNSYGHCSTAAASVCTAKRIRAYFQDGTVPEEGAECDVEEFPFVGKVESDEMAAWSQEEAELFEASRGLSESFPIPAFP